MTQNKKSAASAQFICIFGAGNSKLLRKVDFKLALTLSFDLALALESAIPCAGVYNGGTSLAQCGLYIPPGVPSNCVTSLHHGRENLYGEGSPTWWSQTSLR